MLDSINIFDGYEAAKLVDCATAAEYSTDVKVSELSSYCGDGVLKACRLEGGELIQTYTAQGNHVAVIAGTRLGKTTSYVIPTVQSFARQKRKKSMVISDPKGEIYRSCASLLRQEGYKVILLNFRDYTHSEKWNPLTPIYKKYVKIREVCSSVEVVEENGMPRNKFMGKIYDSQKKLDKDLNKVMRIMSEDVVNDVDNLARMFVATKRNDDPYWEDCARDLLKAFIFAMLEDSEKPSDDENRITEDTFSFSTILSILNSLSDGDDSSYNDEGYFSDRPKTSRAYSLAKNILLENGKPTRRCIVSSLMSKLSIFQESTVRLITSCNSFEMSELVGDKPVAIFIDYRDELKASFQLISFFVQDAYRLLIESATDRADGKLDIPFYFILDEFGNFAPIKDFETTISACAGRNIFFILIIQSYAQLTTVYGADVAEIIKDNLNVHVFMGSNNPATLKAISDECGKFTRISPLSALVGKGREIENYQLETIPLVPVSRLSRLALGEAIVTEANCGYILLSKFERFYMCKEFSDVPKSNEKDYVCSVNPYDDKYIYVYKSNEHGRYYN